MPNSSDRQKGMPIIPLLHNRDYKEIGESIKLLPTNRQIQVYQDIYDKEISFQDYYWAMFPEYKGRTNSPCPLHDEDPTGKSFALDSVRGMWQCFGKCKTVGRVVQFELLWNQKKQDNYTRIKALWSLHEKFPGLPAPVIYSNNDLPIESLAKGIPMELDYGTSKEIKIKHTGDLSLDILNIMLIEKDFRKEYR